MNDLDFLIKRLDGAEVKWKFLGEVAVLQRGREITKGFLAKNAGDFPVYSSQTTNNGVIGRINTYDFNGEYVSWTTDGANAGTVFYRLGKFSITTHCGVIKSNEQSPLNNKFLYYWLSISTKDHVSPGMGNPNLTNQRIKKIPIPIPCPDNPTKSLTIQTEIVRILDKFSNLKAELKAELKARRRQYEYYRNSMLNFEDMDVLWKPLGELFLIRNGYTPSKSNHSYWQDGTVPWFRMDDIRTNGRILCKSLQLVSKSAVKAGRLFPANSIIIATTATIGEHALITVPHISNQQFNSLSLKSEFADKFDMRFIFYYCFILKEWCLKNTRNSSFPSVDMHSFKKFLFPIPPLHQQSEIASKLEKFEALTTSISEGLPREIALRQQQYKFYRDLLLSFPKHKQAA